MSTSQSNDHFALVPRTDFDGPALTFDFPGLAIGVAEYDEGPTGCTVFHFPGPALVAMDVRGGSVGTIMEGDGLTDAICLAGGSLYGLEAATGVAAELFARTGYSINWLDIALVRGAIVYDFAGRNAVYPDKALGRAAVRAARPGVFPLGRRGAARSTSVGGGPGWDGFEPGGQGAAFRQIGETRIAVFTVLNALGMVHDRSGRVVRGGLDRATGERRSYQEQLEARLAAGDGAQPPKGNTTLTVMVTNQSFGTHELRQIGRQVHSALARAIRPFHTGEDGDVLFAVTTRAVENEALSSTSLGVIAADLAWSAALRAVGAEA